MSDTLRELLEEAVAMSEWTGPVDEGPPSVELGETWLARARAALAAAEEDGVIDGVYRQGLEEGTEGEAEKWRHIIDEWAPTREVAMELFRRREAMP